MNTATQDFVKSATPEWVGRLDFQAAKTALPMPVEDAVAGLRPPPRILKTTGRLGRLKIRGTILYLSLLAFTPVCLAEDGAVTWQLLPEVKVDSRGIFLDQLVIPTTTPSSSVVHPHTTTVVLPQLRLAPAPGLGQTASLSRAQINELTQKNDSELVTSNWSGATRVRVSRRTRQFTSSEMTELLAATLQEEYVKDRGELELHLSRPMGPVLVPDEPLTMKVIDLPASGLGPSLVVRCEIWNGKERVGEWQLPVLARVWRDIPVARSQLTRGQLLRDADLVMERRDVLLQRDAYIRNPTDDPTLELTESIATGLPLLNRSVRVRPLMLRGRVVDGVYQEGSMSISLKVELMEDGLMGQTVRVRNPKTKREMFGKVKNEQTVLIAL
jgi:flagella basal body P-ring formation protein FlgA